MFAAIRIGAMASKQGGPWNISTAVYASKFKSISAQDSTSKNIAMSADGTKMYVMNYGTNTAHQYTLSTAWDVSTASYASKSKLVSAQETGTSGLAFSADGTKMYICGISNDTVYQYTLTTAWDLATASYASKSKSVTAQAPNTTCVTFSSDGTKMYVVGITNDTVYQYTLSTAWDVSTASYASKSISVSAQEGNPYALAFSSDGTRMYMVGTANDTVYQYTLSTAWDLATASYASKSKSVSAQETNPQGMAFSSDGTKMYVGGYATASVYQYTLG